MLVTDTIINSLIGFPRELSPLIESQMCFLKKSKNYKNVKGVLLWLAKKDCAKTQFSVIKNGYLPLYP